MTRQPPSGLRHPGNLRLAGTLGIIMLLLLGFGESIHDGFLNYDDPLYLSPPDRPGGFGLQSLRWSFTATHANLWHPLTLLSFQVEKVFAGDSSWRLVLPHLTNLLLYLGTLAVLALGMARLRLPVWANLGFLALFGLHPLHVESVAWISSRKDVLSAFFQALCLLAYLGERKARLPWRSLTLFALAVLSKPSAVVTPALLILVDEALGKREGRDSLLASARGIREQIWQKRWFWLIALLAAGFAVWVQGQGTMSGVARSAGLFERLALAPARIGAYLWKILLPLDLTFEYPVPRFEVLVGFSVLGLVILLVPLTDYLRRRSFSWLGLAFLWMLVCLSPVLGVFLVSDSFINDRYAFWALAGPVAWLVGAAAKLPVKSRLVVGCLVVALLLALTRKQVTVWKSDERLFGHALEIYPAHLTALGNMGTLERSRGRDDLALAYYSRALEVHPYDHIVLYNKAQILADRGRFAEAIDACQKCLAAYPGYRGAEKLLRYLQRKEKQRWSH